MTRAETLQVLTVLRASYPAFYSKFGKAELENIVSLWTDMFEQDDVNIVKYALKELIATHSGYPPDIAALKTKIREICAAASGEATDEELWQMLKRAAGNGLYNAKREFDSLPPVLQRYCGTPNALADMARIDPETLNTVIHGQFLKQIGIIKDRETAASKMPDSVRCLIGQVYKPLTGESVMSIGEFNERRNALLDRLEG